MALSRRHFDRTLSLLARAIDSRFTEMRALMAYTAEAIAATIDAESNRIAGVLDKVRQDLAEALANPDVDTDAAVQEALGVIAPMVDKLKSIGADATQPVPDPTPETDPGADTFPPATDDQAPTV